MTCLNESLMIPGPAGPLEAVIDCPDGEQPAAGVGVVCHPHPQHGGTLQNKVAHTLARTFNARGLVAVRFNFRGVGKSAGEYGEALGETEDLHAVMAWVQARWPDQPLWLGGFSFGAYVALRAAECWPLAQLVTIAPPINYFSFDAMPRVDCDWLLVQGDADEIVPSEEVLQWARRQSPPPQLLELKAAGHFFHGRLNDLKDGILGALD